MSTFSVEFVHSALNISGTETSGSIAFLIPAAALPQESVGESNNKTCPHIRTSFLWYRGNQLFQDGTLTNDSQVATPVLSVQTEGIASRLPEGTYVSMAFRLNLSPFADADLPGNVSCMLQFYTSSERFS